MTPLDKRVILRALALADAYVKGIRESAGKGREEGWEHVAKDMDELAGIFQERIDEAKAVLERGGS